jgi:hypothetical protein
MPKAYSSLQCGNNKKYPIQCCGKESKK